MNILNNERGVVLTFVAMGLFLFLLFLGVALDTGWTVYVRSQGQARVDSAALAGAAGLFDQNTGTRETAAKQLAEDFSDTENPVLTTDTSQAEDVIPMHYNPATRELVEAPSWAPPPNGDFTQPGANAVRVQNAVPTPLFFSGVRNVFGANETGVTDINVDAVGFLGCPAGGLAGPGTAPIALRACRVGFPNNCNVERILYQSPDSGADNSAFTTLFETGAKYCRDLVTGDEPSPPVTVNACDVINTVGSGQVESCFCELQDQYPANICNPTSCAQNPPPAQCVATLPVVDTGCAGEQYGSCDPAGTSMSDGHVVGWARICFTSITKNGGLCSGGGNGSAGLSGAILAAANGNGGTSGGGGTPNFEIRGVLECGVAIPGTGTGTECFGTIAQNPVLIQ
jgi:Flp pilus assembly protein TadG